MFEVTVLGISAATPAFNRHPTAQVLTLPHTKFLIDCGEGTQMQMQRFKVKPNKLKAIFISHLHGDHYLGLLGLLSTMHLQKRQQELYLYGPRPLAELITTGLKHSHSRLSYKLHFHPVPLQGGEIFYEDDQVRVETILMNHRIPCTGFLFRERPKKRKVLAEKLPPGTPWKIMAILKEGENVLNEDGTLRFAYKEYTVDPGHYSFAHCSDTKYKEDIIEQIEGVNLLYHESTFLHSELDKAEMTFHSTAKQAATLAQTSKVGKLLLGHFSSRYKNLNLFLEEAREIFPSTYLGQEGQTLVIESTFPPDE